MGTISSNLCKQFISLSVFLLLFSSPGFSQFYIDQDKIDYVWQNNVKGYWTKPEDTKGKNVYLESFHKAGYSSDIKIGFDKLEYKSDDSIIVTLKRGYENETDSEYVSISGCQELFSSQIKIKRYESGTYGLYLKKGQRIDIIIKHKDRKFVRLAFGLGGIFGSSEGRAYIIVFQDKHQEGEIEGFEGTPDNTLTIVKIQKFMQIEALAIQVESPCTAKKKSFPPLEEDVKKLTENNDSLKPQISVFNPGFNNPIQNVTFSGTLLYEDPQTSFINPVNNWLLLLFESDTYSDLETIDENDPHTDWPVSSSTGNGTYSVTINITKAWFVLGVGLRRYSGTHMVYYLGRWEIIGADTFIVAYDLLTEIGQNIYTQWNFSYTYGGSQTDVILETLRRCAYIGNRIDFSISTNVGGDDLATIQSLQIGTRNDDGVMPDGSGSAFGEPANNTSQILIGPKLDQNYYDAVIIHEHGHTLMFALTNFEWRAGGSHYADQKNRTNMAFSEGWADFWACYVSNNSSLYSIVPYAAYQLDINTVEAKNFIYSVTGLHSSTYLPDGITLYDGVENEGTVAGTFWKLKNDNGISAVWNALKNDIVEDGVSRSIINILEYFAVNSSLKSSFYSNQTRAEELGFGTSFNYVQNTSTLQTVIPTFADKSLNYIQSGNYNVSSPIYIENKSMGIFGMSPKATILQGQAYQNTIQVRAPNAGNDWTKISDLKFTNGGFAIDVVAAGVDQSRIYINRCISDGNMRGFCFAGDAIIVNNFIVNSAISGSGFLVLAQGNADRKIYLYNNTIHNAGAGLIFDNTVNVSGYIANNMFSDNSNGIATLGANAIPNSRSGIFFQFNGTYPFTITSAVGLTVSNNYTDPPFYATDYFYANTNNYEDKGIQISGDDAIFEDLSTGEGYGSERNWVGAYGGKQPHSYKSTLLPSSPESIFTPPVSITGQNVWSGIIETTNTVTIEAGASVEIVPGTVLNFLNGSSLIVNGTLNAIGNVSNPITFNFDDTSLGIRLKQNSTSILDYLVINDAKSGITITQAVSEIRHITALNCKFGIHIANENYASGHSSIEYVTLTNNNYGLWLSNSSPSFLHNEVTGSNKGVYCSNFSSPSLAQSYYVDGDNHITDNTYGVYAYANSNPTLGHYDPYNPYNNYGFNTIINNSSYHLYAEQYCTILAANNWWGSNPPNTALFYSGAGS
ncbi:MAG TPA: hypothetical protein PKA80_14750, partial [Ignavibacteriaceae bacterium]|nr:hypothetical protein [Ignavibacteriaceae bacterium]